MNKRDIDFLKDKTKRESSRTHLNSFLTDVSFERMHDHVKVMKTKGNTNRLQFYGGLEKITYTLPDYENLFGESVVNKLQNLMK